MNDQHKFSKSGLATPSWQTSKSPSKFSSIYLPPKGMSGNYSETKPSIADQRTCNPVNCKPTNPKRDRMTSTSVNNFAYPTRWTQGHNEALTIFCTSLALVRRDLLHSLPCFRPWSGNGWTPLSQHIKRHARSLLSNEGSRFELPGSGKSTANAMVPQDVAQAMEAAIMRYSDGTGQKKRKAEHTGMVKAGRTLGLTQKDLLPEQCYLDEAYPLFSVTSPRRSDRPSAARAPNALVLKFEPFSDDDDDFSSKQPCQIRKRQRYEGSVSSDDDGALWEPPSVFPAHALTAKERTRGDRPVVWNVGRTAGGDVRAKNKSSVTAAPSSSLGPIFIDLTLED